MVYFRACIKSFCINTDKGTDKYIDIDRHSTYFVWLLCHWTYCYEQDRQGPCLILNGMDSWSQRLVGDTDEIEK